jgi:hypothetical protein
MLVVDGRVQASVRSYDLPTTLFRHRVVGRGWAAGGRETMTTKDNQ